MRAVSDCLLAVSDCLLAVSDCLLAVRRDSPFFHHFARPSSCSVRRHHVCEKVTKVESQNGERPQEGLRDEEQKAPDVVGHRVDTCGRLRGSVES